jgi:hypothetical protein
MPALTRRRDPEGHQEVWRVYYLNTVRLDPGRLRLQLSIGMKRRFNRVGRLDDLRNSIKDRLVGDHPRQLLIMVDPGVECDAPLTHPCRTFRAVGSFRLRLVDSYSAMSASSLSPICRRSRTRKRSIAARSGCSHKA